MKAKHLATTALTEFWDRDKDVVFLGPWCEPYGKTDADRVLPSPWNEPGRIAQALADYERVEARLLTFLAERLEIAGGERRSPRYWRIVLGPWVMSFITSHYDRWLTLRAAYAAEPDLTTWTLDRADWTTPGGTEDFTKGVTTDRGNLQIYSALIAHLGRPATTRRWSGPAIAPSPRSSLKGALKRGLFAVYGAVRRLLPTDTYFSDIYFSRSYASRLVLAARLRVLPVFAEMPPSPRFAPETGPGTTRARLAEFPAQDDFERFLTASLPVHFPTLFLEGWTFLRDQVRAEWPKPPRTLVTSVGWFVNEYMKVLAAETVENGGRFIIHQHGGNYGVMTPLHNERHERAVSDEYWTWGWDEPGPRSSGALLRPMPNPRLSFPAPRPDRTCRDWVFIEASLTPYPYSLYYANMPAWHRFEEYIDARPRFFAALPPGVRAAAIVREHAQDFGWRHRERLTRRFPELRFDELPWIERLGRMSLAVIDHPQTSWKESLALNLPTVLFWDPELWPPRGDAQPWLDRLRQVGILHDTPESAAAHVARIAGDPPAWWERPEVQSAREAFCLRHALGRPDWAAIWASRLAKPSSSTGAGPEIV